MTNSMSAGSPDVVKTNRVWIPIYNTLEMNFTVERKVITNLLTHTHTHIQNTHINCILWNKPA